MFMLVPKPQFFPVLKINKIIGKGATIGMGAVVIEDVPPFVTVVGNPARILEN